MKEKDLSPLCRMKEWNSQIESYAKEIEAALFNAPEGPWYDEKKKAISESQGKSAVATIRGCKCTNLCPKCDGEGCKVCHETGYVTNQVFEIRSGK